MKGSNKRETALMGFLCLLIIGAGYYTLFFLPMKERREAAEERIVAAQEQMTIEQIQLVKMNKMKKEIEEIKASGKGRVRDLPKFNNLNMVMMELNGIMNSATSFNISFPEINTEERIIPRGVSITFTAPNYGIAKGIIQRLSDSIYRCTVDGVSVDAKGQTGAGGSADITGNEVNVVIVVTFYEKK